MSEADAEPGLETFAINIFITSSRTSEIADNVNVRSVIEGQPLLNQWMTSKIQCLMVPLAREKSIQSIA